MLPKTPIRALQYVLLPYLRAKGLEHCLDEMGYPSYPLCENLRNEILEKHYGGKRNSFVALNGLRRYLCLLDEDTIVRWEDVLPIGVLQVSIGPTSNIVVKDGGPLTVNSSTHYAEVELGSTEHINYQSHHFILHADDA